MRSEDGASMLDAIEPAQTFAFAHSFLWTRLAA